MKRFAPLLLLLAACSSRGPATPEEQMRELGAFRTMGRMMESLCEGSPEVQSLIVGLMEMVHQFQVDSAIRHMSRMGAERLEAGRISEAEGWFRGVIWVTDDGDVWPPTVKLPEHVAKERATTHAGLARIASVRNDEALALLELGRALEWGWRDFDLLETHPSYAFLKSRPGCRALVEKYKK